MTPHTPAPPATQLDGQTVAQLLLRYLALEGVDTLFGVPGAAVMHLLAELKNQRDKFRYVVARQETGAAYIADGYSRVCGKLGVVLVTSGPGATNALTGTMNAQNAGVSLLTITGEVAEQYFGMGYLQEGTDANLDIDAVYGNASGYSVIVTNASNFQTLFTQALRDALGLPHRAAHISLPDDVAATPVASVHFPNAAHNYRARPHGADPHQAQLAFQRLAGVARPLIFLGSGVREVLQGERLAAFTRMVERYAFPVTTTPDAKAVFPESHPMSLRCFGMAYCEWSKDYLLPSRVDPKLPGGYDSLLVLGTQLGGFSTNKWDPALLPRQSLVQVDLDQTVIGRVFPLDFGAVAELGAFIDELCRTAHAAHPHAGEVKARRELLARIHQRSPYLDPANRDSTKSPILPQAVMKCISDTVPPGSNLFVDSGNCVGFALHYLAVDPPTRVFSALSMGPMGFAVGAVIGAKLAAPQSVCLAIVGDGAFLMHGNEVSTAEANGVAAIWVVLDNNDLAMVSQGMNQFFPDKSGIWNDYYALGKPDIAQFARALGADAYDVKSVEDMQHALGAAINASGLNGKPQVIAVHIDASQIPPYYQDIKPPVHGGSR